MEPRGKCRRTAGAGDIKKSFLARKVMLVSRTKPAPQNLNGHGRLGGFEKDVSTSHYKENHGVAFNKTSSIARRHARMRDNMKYLEEENVKSDKRIHRMECMLDRMQKEEDEVMSSIQINHERVLAYLARANSSQK